MISLEVLQSAISNPLALYRQRQKVQRICVATRIANGKMAAHCIKHFLIKTICNTIWLSHDYYSLLIVIVISGAGMLAHIRIA